MGRHVLVLLCVLLASASWAGFQRPWQNQSWVASNPNIWSYGGEIWWNLPELHGTIDSIGATPVGLDAATAAYSDQASSTGKKAAEAKGFCILSVMGAVGFFPLAPSNLFLEVFSESSYCNSYRRHWKESVDAHLSAVEESTRASETAISRARQACERIYFMGLCDRNYSLAGSENCAEMKSAFASVDRNITEGTYGKYALFEEYAARLRRELRRPLPDLSPGSTMLGLAWGEDGVVPSFNSLERSAKAAEADSESLYGELETSASSHKSSAEKELSSLEREGLGQISRAPAGYSARSGGSVSENLAELQKQSKSLALAYAEAGLEHSRSGKRGYLANAVLGMQLVDEGYTKIVTESAELLEDAEDAVSQQRSEAESELSAAAKNSAASGGGGEAGTILEDAQKYLALGDGAGKLGDRFSFYSKAAASARAARNAPGAAEELGSRSSIASLKSLIESAERDQITVVSEKESLAALQRLDAADAEPLIIEAMGNIVAKARTKYEYWLLSSRERILHKLSLAGSGASDLYTDLSTCEQGIIDGDSIQFPGAVGFLKRLKSDYERIEATLEAYTQDVVGNAMSARASPLINPVPLDEPVDLVLDVVLANPTAYNATHVTASVALDIPMDLLYSDLASGRDDVESVRMADRGKTLQITFSRVGAYETKRLTVGKMAILAHTTDAKTAAEGIGNGAAHIVETIEFEADCNLPALEMPSSESILLDGKPLQGPVSAGRHTLVREATEYGAYSMSIEELRVYRVGTNSKVEYGVRILPERDLNDVLVFIDALNGSQIKSFEITSATGEWVKDKSRVSSTQVSARMLGLKKGRSAMLRVSYVVEDTASFVAEQLELLKASELEGGAPALLERAEERALSGNYTEALELMEKALAASRAAEKELAELQGDVGGMRGQFDAEAAEIEQALLVSSSDAPFMQKLSARKAELTRILSGLNSSNLTQASESLEKVDFKWLGKEITAFKKDAYKQYNDLKERFYAAGNSSTPAEFLQFEESLNRLSSSDRLEYAVEALAALESVESLVESQERASASSLAGLRRSFEGAKISLLDTFDRYSRQASAAKGTDYSGLFTETEKRVDTLIKDAEKSLGGDPRIAVSSLEAMNRSIEKMEATLDSLRNESEAKASLLSALLAEGEMDEGRKNTLETRLVSMRGMASSGEYVNALREGSAIAKELDAGPPQGGSGLLILGVTAMAALAALGFYIYRQPKEKPLRKLPSWGAPTPKASQESAGPQSGTGPSQSQTPRPPPSDSTGLGSSA